MKLLVLIIEGYQEIEVYGFLGTLKRSKQIEKIDYWNPDHLDQVQGVNKIGYITTCSNDVDVKNYDAIFIPGGAACINLRTNKRAINLIKEFIDQDKWIFAICDGPNALFDNNIFVDKKYSSYPIENISNNCGINRTQENVSIDGKYISGKCPSTAIELALKVIESLYGNKLASSVYEEIYGIE